MGKKFQNGLTKEQVEFIQFLETTGNLETFKAMIGANVQVPKVVEPELEPVLTAGQASLDYNEAMAKLAETKADRARYKARALEIKAAIKSGTPWTKRPAKKSAKARRTRALNRLNKNAG